MSNRERERSRCRERIRGLAQAGVDAEEARREAIAALRRAVRFERWCWPLTDPTSGLSTGGIAEFDLWPVLPRLIALQEQGDLTSKPRLIAGPRTTIALSAATGGDLARSRRWRECLDLYGIGDELMTIARDRHGCWGTVELMRDSNDPPFDQDDVGLLEQLAPTLGTLLRRGVVHGWQASRGHGSLPPATLILDAELRPVSWTPAVSEWLDTLGSVHTPDRAERLPPAVCDLAARVLAPPATAAVLPTTVRLRTLNGSWATLEGAPLQGANRRQAAITMRGAFSEEILDLLCRAHDLTPRERQIVALIRDGLATRQLAEALCISPHTVQDHLKAIFAKTGVHSRRQLASHLAGHIPHAITTATNGQPSAPDGRPLAGRASRQPAGGA